MAKTFFQQCSNEAILERAKMRREGKLPPVDATITPVCGCLLIFIIFILPFFLTAMNIKSQIERYPARVEELKRDIEKTRIELRKK